MRRIKLVVSDFHLGTGHRNPDGSINILEDFVLDDKFIEFLEFHSTGDYTTAEVELIVNGDFFNLLQGEVDGIVPYEVTEQAACKQMQAIFDGHPKLFDAMQVFAEQPDKNITFNVGNHDAGLAWPAVKSMVKRRIGSNIQVLNRSYMFDGVHVEHGDKYEPVHYIDPKLPFLSKDLPAAILNLPWASYFFINFVRKLKNKRKYIDKVKPFRNYLTWSALYDFRFFLYTILRLVGFVLKTALFGRVGKKRFGLRSLLVLIRQSRAYPEMRAAKNILRKGMMHTVIFGHTHQALYRQWDPGKEYFNAGCWNGFTNLDIERYGYQVRLTYAYLEWNDERWITTLRIWQGRSYPYAVYLG